MKPAERQKAAVPVLLLLILILLVSVFFPPLFILWLGCGFLYVVAKLIALPFKLARGKPIDPMARAMSKPARLAKRARVDVQAILARDADGNDYRG